MAQFPLLFFAAILLGFAGTTYAQLRITEFVANNDGTYLDEDGDACDWIEIRNSGKDEISTKGCFLTDEVTNLTKWILPDQTISPGGHLIVFASGKNRSDKGSELHTNFSLSANGEYLALVGPETTDILTEFAPLYPKQFPGKSYGFGSTDTALEKTLIPWPANARWIVPDASTENTWTLASFDDSEWVEAQTGIGFGYKFPKFIGPGGDTSLKMRSISPSAYIRIPFTLENPEEIESLTLKMHFEDGVIVYLNGHKILSESAPESPKFNSTAINNLNSEVFSGAPMKEFTIDFAGKLLSGNNLLSFQILNNSLSSSDVLMIPELNATIRVLSENPLEGYFRSPTPGTANSTLTFTGIVADTNFNIDRGFFTEPFEVVVSCKTKGATIIYTTDGSTPEPGNGFQIETHDPNTSPSAVVRIDQTTPLRAAAFRTGLMPANTDTQTYIFLEDVLDQSSDPEGYPVPWKNRNGQIIGGDFGMDPNVVGPIYTREEIKSGLLDVPTISIVTDIANLFDQQTGIQVNSVDSGDGSERRVSVELFNFSDENALQLDAGMRMNGNASRSPTRPKHNFRLIFRDDYGPGRLNFPLFGSDAPTDRFNSIILRGGNGNSWIHPNQSVYNNAMYIRDQWFRDAHHAMGYPEALQRDVHVYFNGLYWGMHHLFERIEEEWSAERFGGEDDQWEGFRIVGGNNIEIINGTEQEVSRRMLKSWQSLLDAAQSIDLDGVQEYLDLDSFIDYLLLNFHAGNNDWDQNNVRAMRKISPSGKYMFFCHDAERAGFNALSSANISINVTNKNTPRGPTSIHTALRSDPEYAIRFADRAHLHLFNEGALNAINGAALWKARANGIRQALKAESARWGDFRGEPPRTLENWEKALTREYENWFPFRNPVTISQLRARGLYPDTDPPEYSQHGGEVPSDFSLMMNNPNAGGTIYFTLDGSDPRVAAGAPDELLLVPENSPVLVLVQETDGELQSNWTAIEFNDTDWQSGRTGVGFEKIAGSYEEPTNLSLESMLGVNASCLIRIPFTIPDQATLNQITSLTLNMKYDDGYAAFINGTFVGGKNNPEPLNWDSKAIRSHLDTMALQFEPIDISERISELVIGKNVLAIQGMNSSLRGSDFLIVPQLSYGTKSTNGISSSALRYSSPFTLSESGAVNARVLEEGVWSALNQAKFIVGVPAEASNLVISEIHYNPAGKAEDTEFIELMNISEQSIQLSGVHFSSGIHYEFADNATLNPMSRMVLTPNEYSGQLDNDGETITLLDASGKIIESFKYNDQSPWHEAPDGNGPSLVRISPGLKLDPSLPSSWRSSVQIDGNPGSSDATKFTGSSPNDLLAYALNDPLSAITSSFKRIKLDDSDNLFFVASVERKLSADDAQIIVEFSSDLEIWSEGVFLGNTEFSATSSTLSWHHDNPLNENFPQRFARLIIRLRSQP